MATSTCDLSWNLNNKSKLLVLLCELFTAFYTVYQVEADADAEMVHTAIASCEMSPIMIVINTDLHVLSIDRCGKRPHHLFFKSEPKHKPQLSCDLLCICRTPGPATNFYLNHVSILDSASSSARVVWSPSGSNCMGEGSALVQRWSLQADHGEPWPCFRLYNRCHLL